jgi:hypothetical protein
MSVPLALDYTGKWVDGCAPETFGELPCDESRGTSARSFEITITVCLSFIRLCSLRLERKYLLLKGTFEVGFSIKIKVQCSC